MGYTMWFILNEFYIISFIMIYVFLFWQLQEGGVNITFKHITDQEKPKKTFIFKQISTICISVNKY